MTEKRWLAGKSWNELWRTFEIWRETRKLWLFACACCRRLGDLIPDPRCLAALEVAERYADGQATDKQLAAAKGSATRVVTAQGKQKAGVSGGLARARERAAVAVQEGTLCYPTAVWTAAERVQEAFAAARRGSRAAERARQTELFRDIFGNPFRPVAFEPAWRTDTAVSLAKGMYESQDFGAMPILADALQDAGCDSDDVLDHCRNPQQVHVRGCWVVDLVLGKS